MLYKVPNTLPVKLYISDWQRLVSFLSKLTVDFCHQNKNFNKLCDNFYCKLVLIVP